MGQQLNWERNSTWKRSILLQGDSLGVTSTIQALAVSEFGILQTLSNLIYLYEPFGFFTTLFGRYCIVRAHGGVEGELTQFNRPQLSDRDHLQMHCTECP